jgi:hypothetical protein
MMMMRDWMFGVPRFRSKGEIWGTIEWKEAVTTVDPSPFGSFGGDQNKVLYSATVNV